jgi:uncharacterized membrane protein SpoIIM required for sporulation
MTPDQLIQARKADWQRLTDLTKHIRSTSMKKLSEAELTELGRLYRLCTSDLAIAQRDFPEHELARYLNQLISGAHSYVYGGEPIVLRRIGTFFARTFPAMFWDLSGYIAISALLFLIPALIGFFVTVNQADSAAYLLNQSLIRDIASGNQWWKDLNEANQVGAAAIMTNNLRVSILAFAGGMTFGLLTLYVTVYNGLLIGMVFGLLQYHGNAAPLAEFVIAHGVLEITEIMLSCAAGLYMGRSMLQPGLLSRGNALAAAARKALKFLLGSLPMLVIAGLIEGFISPSDTITWPAKIAVGLGTGALFAAYVGILGWRERRRVVRSRATSGS